MDATEITSIRASRAAARRLGELAKAAGTDNAAALDAILLSGKGAPDARAIKLDAAARAAKAVLDTALE